MRAIVVVDKNWGIGKKNDLLFRLPADMKHFRETTEGKTVVMGSNTLLSFPGGKPLKNRTNIVLWPGGEEREGCTVVHSLQELFAEIKKYPEDDVFFENLDALPGWVCESEGEPTETNGITIRFCVYKNTGVREFAE